jgi:hypothetical protein
MLTTSFLISLIRLDTPALLSSRTLSSLAETGFEEALHPLKGLFSIEGWIDKIEAWIPLLMLITCSTGVRKDEIGSVADGEHASKEFAATTDCQ